MKRRIFILVVILISIVGLVYASSVPTRYSNYVTGGVVTADNLNGNLNNVYNVLNAGLTNDNVDVDGGYRFIEILAELPAAGNQGRVVFYTTSNTLYFDTGLSMLAVAMLGNSQTFTGTNTFNGAIDINSGSIDGVNIGVAVAPTVTNIDINGGTLDGVQIGTTTATGELIVNDSNDDADGLGSQGTSGQFLQSAGAGANPVFATATGHSNVIFHYQASINFATNDDGEAYSDTLYDNTAGIPTYRYLMQTGTTERIILTSKWKKIAGVSTVTVNGQLAVEDGGDTGTLKVDIGGANGSGTTSSTSFVWVSFTVDVSGLSNGTVYDVQVILDNSANETYAGTIIMFGS